MARRAEAVGSYGISYSFGKLRAVLDSFASLSDGRPTEPGVERRAIRPARELGAPPLPPPLPPREGWGRELPAAYNGAPNVARATAHLREQVSAADLPAFMADIVDVAA